MARRVFFWTSAAVKPKAAACYGRRGFRDRKLGLKAKLKAKPKAELKAGPERHAENATTAPAMHQRPLHPVPISTESIWNQQLVHEPLESVGKPRYDGSIIKFDEYGRSMPRDLVAMDLAAGHVSKALPEPVLSGWGRLPMPGRELLSEHLEQATVGAVLSRGLGRSYGDSSLPAHAGDRVVGTRLANRILEFDEATGRMRAEAGLSLAELNRLFIPRGWFSPVTPGTKFVTLGGMVASDVHGKNHHREGCFGAHVHELRVRLADDTVVECSPEQEPDLFYGSIGGMGLLGHILEVTFSLRHIPTSWLTTQSVRVGNIDEFLDELGTAAPAWPMTMGWIDCLNRGRGMGRGILMAGRWATVEEARAEPPRRAREMVFPFELPNWALNATTARLFNMAYYWRHLSKRASGLTAPDPFFYPLDAILNWNRAYGSRGFSQYQCVLPRAGGKVVVREFMEHLTRLGGASPLCVIKDCGPEGKGVLSFPMEGTSIAVDMPATPDLQRIVDRLNEFVIAAGGRIYLTKDRFTRPEHFKAMEPRLPRFLALRDKWDPARRLRSAQSRRLFGDK